MSDAIETGTFECDAEDLAGWLDEASSRIAKKTGDYELAGLLDQAAQWIRKLDEDVSEWESVFFGNGVRPKHARKMVEDRAKAEAEMDALGVTPRDIAETMPEDVR